MFDESLLWWEYLTREEWQALYAISCCEEMLQIRATGLSVSASMKDLLRRLVLEHGVRFTQLCVAPDGELWTEAEESVEPRNALFAVMLQKGRLGGPDYLIHMLAAVDWAQKQDGLERFVELLRDGLQRVKNFMEGAVRAWDEGLDKKQKEHIQGLMRKTNEMLRRLNL